MEVKKQVEVSGYIHVFYSRASKLFYHVTRDGKAYTRESEVADISSIDFSVSMIVPEEYFLLRIENKHLLGIPFDNGTMLWRPISKKELKMIEKRPGA
jgi:hypothetical protein